VTTRVYQFALLPPSGRDAALVDAQMRLAWEARQDMAMIERGRRSAMRALLDTPDVRAAEEALKAATRSTRKDVIRVVSRARRDALERAVASERYDDEACQETGYCPLYEPERIEQLAKLATKGAYHYFGDRGLAWGTRLDVSGAADAARKAPLYDDDGLTPSDPHVERWYDAKRPPDSQLAVQLQGGLSTPDGLTGQDTRVRLVDGVLWLRVGSDGRAPVWAKFAIARPHRTGKRGVRTTHRAIPDDAKWKWVRVSRRRDGPWMRWSVEITLDVEREDWRVRDPQVQGVLAVEVCWDRPDDAIVVARWRDDSGRSGTIELPDRIATGLPKVHGIRAVRDTIRADMAKRLQRALTEDRDPKPVWLADAAGSMHLWKSSSRFHRLIQQWQDERCDAARPAYELLDAWRLRDNHLYEYETGARGNVLRWRKNWYQTLAAEWARRYRIVVLDDRNLSREARWGEASEIRFMASPFELRQAIRNAFGRDVAEHTVKQTEKEKDEDDRDWCERALDARNAGVARTERETSEIKDKRGGAWAKRKQAKTTRHAEREAARKAVVKAAE